MKKNCFCKILITLKKNFYDVFHYNNFTAKLFSTIKGRIKKKNIPPFPLSTKNLPIFSSLNCESI